jgi:predicted polyphosphate/ATP-dependent NAD kinase
MAAGRKVGIIANPASGKDIRRLVAYGSVFDNEEKVNIVRRILLGLEAAGVDEVLIMPDTYGIGARALDGLSRRKLRPRVDIIQMEIGHSGVDSTLAARLLKEQGVGAIVVLGGDGTCRAVAKGCGVYWDKQCLPDDGGGDGSRASSGTGGHRFRLCCTPG